MDEANQPRFVQQKTNTDRLRVLHVCGIGGDVGAPGAVAHNESVSMVLGDEHEDETDQLDKARHESDAELVKLRITAGSPFTKLGHHNEKQVDMRVRVHLMSVYACACGKRQILREHQKPLSSLEAWLEKKKQGGMMHTYQRR